MNESRFEFKVGLFVFVGLALIALLILNFSKGVTLFNPTYNLHVIMPSMAGLKPTADVMMAGVPIGKVSRTDLAEDGRSVNIELSILSKYKIRREAVFHIDALGFLGDQYVEVSPPAETGPIDTNTFVYLKEGETIIGETPFNMQEAVRSVSGLLDQAKKTMKDLDQAITNINRTVLSAATLGRFGLAVSNLQNASAIAVKVVAAAETLVDTNSPTIRIAITNFAGFSEKLKTVADELDQVIVTNQSGLTETIKNLRDSSASFKLLSADLEAGKGVAGSLLKDEQLKVQMASLVTNANAMAETFAAFGSNLNQRGLWSILWKPKHPEKSPSSAH
ncbi:MAG TPA: MlaD family protein [Candidatus Saccharimonadales bacterium]|nr:MlaD family protein [Candidatus Saccharimonadales bacterium]